MDIDSFKVTVHVTAHAGDPGEYRCPSCGTALKIHQPEEAFPARLLGSCPCVDCGLWYLIRRSPFGASVYMVRLPEMFELREAWPLN